MASPRIIPVLLLKRRGLWKGEKFDNTRYIGDPIEGVKIFNDKEADELVIFDTEASIVGAEPDFSLLEKMVSEAFIPIGYGGGISKIQHLNKLFTIGIEKAIINSYAYGNYDFLREAVAFFGSQSVVVSIDIRRNGFGEYELYSHSGTVKKSISLMEHLHNLQSIPVGEIIVNNIDKDGMMNGMDIQLIKDSSNNLDIPLIAGGGAGNLEDLKSAILAGASGVAAGSIFVFQRKNGAVSLSYPAYEELAKLLH